MNPFRNRPLLFCSLILYTLLLTAALLYLRFPTEDVKLFCQGKLAQLLPETQCSIANFRYKFPFGLEVKTINFTDKQKKPQTLFTVGQALISTNLSAPLSQFHVAFSAYGGTHDFTILINRSEQTVTLENIHLVHLNLAEIPILGKASKREITGSLSGNATFRSSWNVDKPMRSGRGNMKIDKGSFGLLFPILSLKKIDLEELRTDFTFQKDRIQVSKGYFQGKELKGEFGGDLALRTPFELSALAFNGTLEPLPALQKKSKYAQNMVIQLEKLHNRTTLPFLLQGSVQRPRFKFDT